MTNIVVKCDTVLCMGVKVIISQSEMSPERLMISQTPSMRGHQITSGGRKNVEETLPAFGVTFAKPFLHKIGYSKPFKIVKFWTFHMSVFVNMTNTVVNSDTDSTYAWKL